MRVRMRFSLMVAQSPKVLRYFVAPLIWRILALVLTSFVGELVDGKLKFLCTNGQDYAAMYYAISGVYGVVAGFLITAMTIVVVSDSDSALSIKHSAPESIPFKFVYGIITLILLSLMVALLGPFSSNSWTKGFIFGSILIALTELLIVVLFVLGEILPQNSCR